MKFILRTIPLRVDTLNNKSATLGGIFRSQVIQQ